MTPNSKNFPDSAQTQPAPAGLFTGSTDTWRHFCHSLITWGLSTYGNLNMFGTSNQPCWLAEACNVRLHLLLLLQVKGQRPAHPACLQRVELVPLTPPCRCLSLIRHSRQAHPNPPQASRQHQGIAKMATLIPKVTPHHASA